ncbi:WXG100 family type VII secretion target [Mycobacterium sp.]|uniref:WXG100 family type VII secretion target n=1 Tax=Mycobacterium sp. TaxID=1785 RepID=UPI003BAD680E
MGAKSSALKELLGGVSFSAGTVAGGLIGYEIGNQADGQSGAQTGESLGAMIGGTAAGIAAIALTGQYRGVLGTFGHMGEILGEMGTGYLTGSEHFQRIGDLAGYGVGSGLGKGIESYLGARANKRKSASASKPDGQRPGSPTLKPDEQRPGSSRPGVRRRRLRDLGSGDQAGRLEEINPLEEESLSVEVEEESRSNVTVLDLEQELATVASVPPQPKTIEVFAEVHCEHSAASGDLGAGGSGVIVNDPDEVVQAAQQMRRVSGSLRDSQREAEALQGAIQEDGSGETNTAFSQRLQGVITRSRRLSDVLEIAIDNICNGSEGLAVTERQMTERLVNSI